MVKFFYLSDIQWSIEKDLALKYLEKKLRNNNFDVLVINGDIGNNGELMDEIKKIIEKNKENLKNKKILINLGNHDNFLDAMIIERELKEKGFDVKFAYKDEVLDLYGLKTLLLPGAHQISGPGNIAKNAFYYDSLDKDLYIKTSRGKNLLPTGYYLIEKDNLGITYYKKIDDSIIKDLADFIYFNKKSPEGLNRVLFLLEKKEYLQNYLKDLLNLKEKLKDDYKKEIEKDESKIKEELEKIEEEINKTNLNKEFLNRMTKNLNEIIYLLENKDKLYLHINSKEIAEKYKNENFDIIFSHDPIKHPKNVPMGYVEGIKVNEDYTLTFRTHYNDKLIEIPILLKKGVYNKNFEFIPFLQNQIVEYILKNNLNQNIAKDILEDFNKKLNFIEEYLKSKGIIESDIYEASDPYLTDLLKNSKYAFFGHIEREYRLFDKEGKKVFPKEKKTSLYALIHSKNWIEYLKDIYLDLNKEKGKVIFEDVDKEVYNEVISNLY